MTRFVIKHAFVLKSARDKLLTPGIIFTPENEEQEKEIRDVFMKDGAVEELKSQAPVAPATPTGEPPDDLSTVPGVGKNALEKLAAKGITTVAQLKAAVADAAKD